MKDVLLTAFERQIPIVIRKVNNGFIVTSLDYPGNVGVSRPDAEVLVYSSLEDLQHFVQIHFSHTPGPPA